jgi:hypothetical protein
MTNYQRRQFLLHLTAAVGGVSTAACGGGGNDAGAAPSGGQATGPLAPTPMQEPVPEPKPDPQPATPAVPTGPARFTLNSSASISLAPFCLGYAFQKGHVPARQALVSNIANLQVTQKNYWPDGSLKFAVIAGTVDLIANTPLTASLSAGTPSTSGALTTSNLKATGISALVDCGAFGTATWASDEWDAPFQTWVSGPHMSSWVYRKPIGTDAHLVAWLEVRLFAGGSVEVLPWIENGYLRVAGPTNKSTTFSFTLGGTQRFSAAIDLPNHCRTPLVSGSALSYWLAVDPQVSIKHDTNYLQATALVPSYRAEVASNSQVIGSLATTYTPLNVANHSPAMGMAGYHGSIGLLPEWDVVYLTSQSPKAYAGLIVNAYAAGRYGIHFRDETTQRPLRFSSYPNLVVGGGSGISSSGASSTNSYTPSAGGTNPATWASSHHPSLGFLAYLVTGRWYFMEEVQFVATLNYLKNTDIARNGAQGVFQSAAGANTTRGAAWAVRSLAQAACATPDDDIGLRNEFLASMQANVDWNHARYVAQANNPFGWVAPYSDYTGVGDNVYFEAAWMQDFYTAAFGYAKAMEPALPAASSQRLTEFFAWKAQSIIGRLGDTALTDYLYADAAQYTIAVAPTDTPDFDTGTGPWHANWGAIYKDTLKTPNPGAAPGLRGANFPEATSYWGNLQPAIAYAVQHQVTGAAEAYQRMASAPNWPQMLAAFHDNPVWAVQSMVAITAPPASTTTLPAWVAALPLWQWYEIPNTALSSVDPSPRPLGITGPSSKIDAWCGACLKRSGSHYMLGAAGGHGDYAGNEVNSLALNVATPQWSQLRAPTPNSDIINSTQFYLDNRPSATHTYYASQFIESLNRLMVFSSPGVFGPFPSAPSDFPYLGDKRSFSFNLTTGDWDGPDYVAQFPGTGDFTAALCVKHPWTDDVYYSKSYGSGWYRWTSATNTWSKLSNVTRAPWYAGAAIDPLRNRVLLVGGFSAATPEVRSLDGSLIPATFVGLGAAALALSGYPGVQYDEATDRYVVAFNSGTTIKILRVHPDTWFVDEPALTGNAPAARANGVQNAMQYVPELKGFVLANRHNGNVYFFRTSA